MIFQYFISWAFLSKVRRILCNFLLIFVGYLGPSLSSAKAVISQDTDSVTEWLTYWAVFSCFILVESFFDFFLNKVPLYYEFKVVSVCWLTLPDYQGAYKIYHGLVKPYFEENEEVIDKRIDAVTSHVRAGTVTILKRFLYQLWTGAKGDMNTALLGLVATQMISKLNVSPSDVTTTTEPTPSTAAITEHSEKNVISVITNELQQGELKLCFGYSVNMLQESKFQVVSPSNIYLDIEICDTSSLPLPLPLRASSSSISVYNNASARNSNDIDITELTNGYEGDVTDEMSFSQLDNESSTFAQSGCVYRLCLYNVFFRHPNLSDDTLIEVVLCDNVDTSSVDSGVESDYSNSLYLQPIIANSCKSIEEITFYSSCARRVLSDIAQAAQLSVRRSISCMIRGFFKLNRLCCLNWGFRKLIYNKESYDSAPKVLHDNSYK
jgi:hypothetical protein